MHNKKVVRNKKKHELHYNNSIVVTVSALCMSAANVYTFQNQPSSYIRLEQNGNDSSRYD